MTKDQELRKLLVKRDQAHQKVLQSRSTRSTASAYKDACRQIHQHTRSLKTAWWEEKQSINLLGFNFVTSSSKAN